MPWTEGIASSILCSVSWNTAVISHKPAGLSHSTPSSQKLSQVPLSLQPLVQYLCLIRSKSSVFTIILQISQFTFALVVTSFFSQLTFDVQVRQTSPTHHVMKIKVYFREAAAAPDFLSTQEPKAWPSVSPGEASPHPTWLRTSHQSSQKSLRAK